MFPFAVVRMYAFRRACLNQVTQVIFVNNCLASLFVTSVVSKMSTNFTGVVYIILQVMDKLLQNPASNCETVLF